MDLSRRANPLDPDWSHYFPTRSECRDALNCWTSSESTRSPCLGTSPRGVTHWGWQAAKNPFAGRLAFNDVGPHHRPARAGFHHGIHWPVNPATQTHAEAAAANCRRVVPRILNTYPTPLAWRKPTSITPRPNRLARSNPMTTFAPMPRAKASSAPSPDLLAVL